MIIKLSILLLMLVTLFACNNPMTNDNIIAECKKCEEAGMEAHAVHGPTWSGDRIVEIQCWPKAHTK